MLIKIHINPKYPIEFRNAKKATIASLLATRMKIHINVEEEEEVVWTSTVGTKSGANITKQVVSASQLLQEKQEVEAIGARYSGIEPGSHPRHPNPLNRARERRRARLDAEPTRPGGQGEESSGPII